MQDTSDQDIRENKNKALISDVLTPGIQLTDNLIS